jgi:hypothetical protein
MKTWLRQHRILIGCMAGLGVGFACFLQWGVPRYAAPWIQSEGFRQMLSRQVSQSIKVEGEFTPFQSKGWTVRTDSFESEGRPGEAIGRLRAYTGTGVFNPWAIFWRVWQIDTLHAQRGYFELRWPDDSQKKPLIKKPAPWYAFLMPTRFFCKEIFCDNAEVLFPFADKTGRLYNLVLRAEMIKQDFLYKSKEGDFEFALLPPMKVDNLEVFVDRYKAELRNIQLRESNGPGKLAIFGGRIGMRTDKSIRGDIQAENLDFSRILPPTVKGHINGRLTGKIRWDTDETGQNTTSGGTVILSEVTADGWPFLDDLRRVLQNPAFESLHISKAECTYRLGGKLFAADSAEIDVPGMFRVKGSALYDWNTHRAGVDVTIRDWNLAAFLPSSMQVRQAAPATATLHWSGPLDKPDEAKGNGRFQTGDTILKCPPQLKRLLAKYKIVPPPEIELTQVLLPFSYDSGEFALQDFYIQSATAFQIHGHMSWSKKNECSIDASFQHLPLERWAPTPLKNKLFGTLQASAQWHGPGWNWDQGHGTGTLAGTGIVTRGMGWQETARRFFKDSSWEKLPWKRCSVRWTAVGDGMQISDLDLFSPGKAGVRGAVNMDQNKKLKGQIKIGLSAKNLEWLPEATTAVFKEKRDGLFWATVKISGDLENPKHDLGSQIRNVLLRHPLALAGLALRGVSWWLGDFFGIYK